MPIPKRWHPVSRDLNEDPELWELTDLFTDRSIRTWMEILSIIDRTENSWRLAGQWLAGISRKTRQKPASIQRQIDWMVAKGWLTVVERLPDGSPAVLRTRNYFKYHKRSEPKGVVSGPDCDANGSRERTPSFTSLSLPTEGKTGVGGVDSVDFVDRGKGKGERQGEVGNGKEGFAHASEIVQKLLRNAEQSGSIENASRTE